MTTKPTVAELRQELAKTMGELAQMQQAFSKKKRHFEGMHAHAVKEFTRLKAEPPSKSRDQAMHVYGLRAVLAQKSIASLAPIINFNFDPEANPNGFNSTKERLELTMAELKYVGLAYQVANYEPVVDALRQALGGVQRSATGPLSGTAPLQDRSTTGPLSQRAGTGPFSQRAGSGPLAQRASTGPLSQRAGSGPLAQQTLAEAPAAGSALQLAARKLAANPASRRGLESLLSQFDEIKALLQGLQGESPGVLNIALPSGVAEVAKLNGKAYYLNRTLQELGAGEGPLAFELSGEDASLRSFLSDFAGAGEAEGKGGMFGALKSLFKG